MRTVIIAIGLLVIGSVGLALLWPKEDCAATETCSTNQKTEKSQADIINDEVRMGTATLLDVRQPEEYAVSHAGSATLMPIGDIEAGKFDEPDKDRKLYVYCRSGNRSAAAKQALKKQGYTNVTDLGGLADWQALGGEVASQ